MERLVVNNVNYDIFIQPEVAHTFFYYLLN